MTYQSLMTKNEAAALSAALLTSAAPGALMDRLHSVHLPSDAARCALHAIRVLASKDLDVNVITVFEEMQRSSYAEFFPLTVPRLSLEVLNSIALEVTTKGEVIEYLDSLLNDMDD